MTERENICISACASALRGRCIDVQYLIRYLSRAVLVKFVVTGENALCRVRPLRKLGAAFIRLRCSGIMTEGGIPWCETELLVSQLSPSKRMNYDKGES